MLGDVKVVLTLACVSWNLNANVRANQQHMSQNLSHYGHHTLLEMADIQATQQLACKPDSKWSACCVIPLLRRADVPASKLFSEEALAAQLQPKMIGHA